LEVEVLGVVRMYGNKIWIPKVVRDRLRLKDGDRVYFYENDAGEIVIKKSEKKFTLK